MKKKIVICFIVILLVIILHLWSGYYTEKTMNNIETGLNELRENILKENPDNVQEQVKKIIADWNTRKEVLSSYIEHDELEKAELYLYELNSNVDVKDYDTAIQSLDSCNFIISHIKDKYKLTIANIF